MFNESSRFYWEYSTRIHREKLKAIGRRIDNSPPRSNGTLPFLKKAHVQSVKNKTLNIYKQNLKISAKITSKYNSPISKFTFRERRGPGSLNFPYRKSNQRKIDSDNRTMIRSLSRTKSQLSKKYLRPHIEFNNNYKRNRQAIWRKSRGSLSTSKRPSMSNINEQSPTISVKHSSKNSHDFFLKNTRKYKIKDHLKRMR